jgi:hypothetical protein
MLGGNSNWEWNMVKTWSTAAEYYSPELSGIQSLATVYAKSIAQNPMSLRKSCRGW